MTVEIAGYKFEGWFRSEHSLDRKTGVYIVGCERTASVEVLDVGESHNIRESVLSHERRKCWKKHCGVKYNRIVYAQHLTMNLEQNERMEIEKEIRNVGTPPCGEE